MSIERINKDGIYGFKSDKIKVEFSEPTIQTFDENAYCKSEKNIMYYYYVVTIWVKEYERWKKFFDIYPYDFPDIINFKNMLNDFILDKIDLSCYQKEKSKRGTWYTYQCSTGSIAEDCYSVSHTFIDEGYKRVQEQYSISVGKALDYSNEETISVAISDLTKEDLQEIYNCVSDFIKYSIDKNNEIVIERNKKDLTSWKSENGKLYKMKEDGKSIESVFIVGDKIDDAIVLKGDINTTDFSSFRFINFTIDEIKEDAIVISSGVEEDSHGNYRDIKKPEEIKLNCLLALYTDMSEEKLHFNEEQILEDFKNILSEKEKTEFATETIDYLFVKWKDAIIGRTWMCRDEHNLPKRIEDAGYHENVYASVKVIIEQLKEKLKNN